MKVYRIKTNDFAKLTSNKNLLTTEQKAKLENIEKQYNMKSKRFLPRGKDIVLIIGQDNKYYITSRPCYVDSIVKILESVNIAQDSIVLVNRQTAQNDLSIEQLKDLLLED